MGVRSLRARATVAHGRSRAIVGAVLFTALVRATAFSNALRLAGIPAGEPRAAWLFVGFLPICVLAGLATTVARRYLARP